MPAKPKRSARKRGAATASKSKALVRIHGSCASCGAGCYVTLDSDGKLSVTPCTCEAPR